MVHGKHKGNAYENKVYKEIREVLPDVKLTIGSGNSESDADLVSDVYLFELKRYKKVDDSMINKWWDKVCGEAYKHDKIPVIVYKEDYKDAKVVTWVQFEGCTLRAMFYYDDFLGVLKDGN